MRFSLNLNLQLHEPVRLWSSADKQMSFYYRASRYRRLLLFVAQRVLGNPDRADMAVENCLYSASRHAPAFDCEGSFRSWLVRMVIDEALAILHGRNIPEHRHKSDARGIGTALLSS